MSQAFENRVVIVTGASQGIGAAVAGAFAEQGAKVVSFDLQSHGPSGAERHEIVDVRDRTRVDEAIAGVAADLGAVDVLVNNAGILQIATVAQGDAAGWDAVIRTNLLGGYHCASAAIRQMQTRRTGAIVTISSAAAFLGIPGRAPYAASKAGLLAFTRTLAAEVGPYGIRVNAIAPGPTRTQLVSETIAQGLLDEAATQAAIPLGRLARPSEIAAAVRFLAGEDASYITGQVITVDGGWSVARSQAASAPDADA